MSVRNLSLSWRKCLNPNIKQRDYHYSLFSLVDQTKTLFLCMFNYNNELQLYTNWEFMVDLCKENGIRL